ncbi:MAG: CPBP family intramembrane glutamic endopeptidase [Planctomycetota bacterium]
MRRDRLELLGFGAFFAVAMVGVALLGEALGQRESTIRAMPLLVMELALLALVAPVVWLLQAWRGLRLRDLDLFVPPEGWRRACFVGVTCGIAIKIATIVLAVIVVPLGASSGGPVLVVKSPLDLLAFVLAGCVAAAIEELVFRGYLTDRVGRAFRWPRMSWATGAVTSLLFSLGHGYQGMIGLIVSMFVGLAFFAMLRSGKYHLVHCIAAHATFNAIAFSAAAAIQ